MLLSADRRPASLSLIREWLVIAVAPSGEARTRAAGKYVAIAADTTHRSISTTVRLELDRLVQRSLGGWSLADRLDVGLGVEEQPKT